MEVTLKISALYLAGCQRLVWIDSPTKLHSEAKGIWLLRRRRQTRTRRSTRGECACRPPTLAANVFLCQPGDTQCLHVVRDLPFQLCLRRIRTKLSSSTRLLAHRPRSRQEDDNKQARQGHLQEDVGAEVPGRAYIPSHALASCKMLSRQSWMLGGRR